jgi:hypothetical protein
MMTAVPLFALVVANLALRLPAPGRALMAVLGIASLATTAALYRAAQAGSIRLAVDPFDMEAWLFQATAAIFPDYRGWDEATVLLTALWLTLLMGAAVWLVRREDQRWLFNVSGILRTARLRRLILPPQAHAE